MAVSSAYPSSDTVSTRSPKADPVDTRVRRVSAYFFGAFTFSSKGLPLRTPTT